MSDQEEPAGGELLNRRVRAMKLSPTIAMSERAGAMRRAGLDVISLAIGELDFDTPRAVADAAHKAALDGFTRYTAPDGAPLIKDAVRAKLLRDSGLAYERNEVHVTSGCKQVLYNAFAATLEAGDEVVIFAPCWVSYIDQVEFCGGVATVVETGPEAGFLPSPQALAAALTPRTKWVLLNSPNNPTGAVMPAALLRALGGVILSHPRALVLSDEIYEHLTYDGVRHVAFPEAVPALRDRTLVVNGVSKSHAMTGWRVGFGAGPAWLVEAMARIQSQAAGSSSSIGQAAGAAALEAPPSHLGDWLPKLRERRDRALSILARASGVSAFCPQGAFYIYLGVAGLIGKTSPSGRALADDVAVAEYLLDEAHVATVAGEAFALSPYVRLSFALDIDRVAEACERIVRATGRLHRETSA